MRKLKILGHFFVHLSGGLLSAHALGANMSNGVLIVSCILGPIGGWILLIREKDIE